MFVFDLRRIESDLFVHTNRQTGYCFHNRKSSSMVRSEEALNDVALLKVRKSKCGHVIPLAEVLEGRSVGTEGGSDYTKGSTTAATNLECPKKLTAYERSQG